MYVLMTSLICMASPVQAIISLHLFSHSHCIGPKTLTSSSCSLSVVCGRRKRSWTLCWQAKETNVSVRWDPCPSIMSEIDLLFVFHVSLNGTNVLANQSMHTLSLAHLFSVITTLHFKLNIFVTDKKRLTGIVCLLWTHPRGTHFTTLVPTSSI